MKKNVVNSNQSLQKDVNEEIIKTEGYPVYPENEDIYYRFKKEKSIDPDHITKRKEPEILGKENEKDFNDDVTGSDLDIPGTKFEEIEDVIGLEDEENNYFSLGGDDHIDLEEDLG